MGNQTKVNSPKKHRLHATQLHTDRSLAPSTHRISHHRSYFYGLRSGISSSKLELLNPTETGLASVTVD